MKNKLFKILSIFVLFITFGIGFNCSSVNASWKIENDTLTIYNETRGNLADNFESDQFGKYKTLVIEGEIDSFDFVILESKSRQCETIDLSCAKITTIPGGVFQMRSNLKKFVLPKNLEIIEQGAFAHCSNIKIDSLPKNLRIIESGAFFYCRELDLTVPENVIVCNNAFKYCPNVRLLKNLSVGEIKDIHKSSQKSSLLGALLSLIKWS